MRVSMQDDGPGCHDMNLRSWWVEVSVEDAPQPGAFGAVAMFNFDAPDRAAAEAVLRSIGGAIAGAEIEDGMLTFDERAASDAARDPNEFPF